MRLIDADKLLTWIDYWDKNITKDINAPDVGEANTIIKDVLQTVFEQITDMDTLEWIPVSEGLPEELETVLITWKNTNPASYYKEIKNVPFTNPAVYYRGKWYWWDSTIRDFLAEYGDRFGETVPIDADIEVIAWMRLPEPWEGEEG